MSQAELLFLYRTYYHELVAYAVPLLGEVEMAQDVVQEAYLKLHTMKNRSKITDPLAYFYRVVRNLGLDVLRGRHREIVYSQTHGDIIQGGLSTAPLTPEDMIGAQEDLSLLYRYMEGLPRPMGCVLSLHWFQDYTIRQIAQDLGLSVGAVHKILHEGMVLCKGKLKIADGTA